MDRGGKKGKNRLGEICRKYERELLEDWLKGQLSAPTVRPDLMKEADLHNQSTNFLGLFVDAAQSGNTTEIEAREWDKVREALEQVSRERAENGFTPSETATYIFSLKQPVFSLLRKEMGNDAIELAEAMWETTVLIDKLGLYTTEVFQQVREEIISRQQEEILELSTPVVKLWEGILAVPMIGTLDSARTQEVMETLLESIVNTGSSMAIIDITGVPAVDTMVAQHLIKTVSAARLMGAECIISGIRPQIAQTVVTLGVDLTDIITKATMADAFATALEHAGLCVKASKD